MTKLVDACLAQIIIDLAMVYLGGFIFISLYMILIIAYTSYYNDNNDISIYLLLLYDASICFAVNIICWDYSLAYLILIVVKTVHQVYLAILVKN